jgi:hypothetical protein
MTLFSEGMNKGRGVELRGPSIVRKLGRTDDYSAGASAPVSAAGGVISLAFNWKKTLIVTS